MGGRGVRKKEEVVLGGKEDGVIEEEAMVRKYNEGDVDETREEEENMKVEKRKEREKEWRKTNGEEK